VKNSEIYVVVPVFNEEKHIKRCLSHILEYWSRIIVVDDGSGDKTLEIAQSFAGVEVVKVKKNRGKGEAMRRGARRAWQKGAKAVIFMDGDNQHHPESIEKFVKLLKRGNQIVIGMRLLKTDIPLVRKFGNIVMSQIMRVGFGVQIPDMMCGFRAFTKSGFKSLTYTSQDYGVEVEMLTLVGRKKLEYETIIVETIYHDRYKGFSIWDGLKIIWRLPYYKIRAL